jgi:hypothetical protein
VLRIFYRLGRVRTRDLRSSGKHTNHYTTKATRCLHILSLKFKAVGSIPEDNNVNLHIHQNLKYRTLDVFKQCILDLEAIPGLYFNHLSSFA